MNLWAQIWFDEVWSKQNIAVLELYPLLVALHIFVAKIRHHKVIFHTDSMAVVHAVNKKSCRDPIMMSFLRRMSLKALSEDISFVVTHISGSTNVLPDKISRFRLSQAELWSLGMAIHLN